MGLNVSYHNLASLVRVKQNLCTFATSGRLCISIQSFVVNKWTSTSSSGLPENSGLKYDQFNCGIWTGGVGGNIGLGTGTGGFCSCIRSGSCAGGFCGLLGLVSGGAWAEGSCGIGGAGSATWSWGTITYGSGWGWEFGSGGSVALVFAGLHAVSSFGCRSSSLCHFLV